MPPLIAISMGDPTGVGPEVVVKALSVGSLRHAVDTVVYGDQRVLTRAIEASSLKARVVSVPDAAAARAYRDPDVVPVVAVSDLGSVRWGEPEPATDAAQVEYIKAALKSVHGMDAAALVTAPISKAAIRRAGAPWPGHTEMLAELISPPGGPDAAIRPWMMLAGESLRTVPLTTHVAYAEVPSRLSIELLVEALHVTHDALHRFFGCPRPRIAVAGLNPHAGEGGLFGREEATIIAPAIEVARKEGLDVTGPQSADTVFLRAVRGEYDAVIGMHHDQALIPVKLLDFDRAVNVTLGLPVIRTSVDHGTAYDIAGQGVASATSLIAAIELAASMVTRSVSG